VEIETRFGPQTISEDDIITFPQGIPGFSDLSRFKLFREEDGANILLLQSVDDADVSFAITDPAQLRVNYEVTLSDEELEILQADQDDTIAILVLLYQSKEHPSSTDETPSKINANLLGPIMLNTDKKTGMQKVLNDVEQFVTIRSE
jgi:flagellar assembly factor FliW